MRESYQPVAGETIVHIDCIAAGAQSVGHSGVSAPIYNLCRHDTIADADAWIEANLKYESCLGHTADRNDKASL